jgi:hypothetical protein
MTENKKHYQSQLFSSTPHFERVKKIFYLKDEKYFLLLKYVKHVKIDLYLIYPHLCSLFHPICIRAEIQTLQFGFLFFFSTNFDFWIFQDSVT